MSFMPAMAIFIRTFFSICAHRENWIASSKPEPPRSALASSSAAASPASTASDWRKKLTSDSCSTKPISKRCLVFDEPSIPTDASIPQNCSQHPSVVGRCAGNQRIFRRGCGFKNTGFESRVSGLGFRTRDSRPETRNWKNEHHLDHIDQQSKNQADQSKNRTL